MSAKTHPTQDPRGRPAAAANPRFDNGLLASATMRGDDALARAAADVAAPRRRLLAALRDAHAEACLRIGALQDCAATLAGRGKASSPARAASARLLAEAEEQLRRLEILFVQLRERPGAGLPAACGTDPVAIAASAGPDRDAALLLALEAEERRGVAEAETLRDLAHLAGQHLVARLLDITAAERAASARALAALLRGVAGAARH